MAKLDLRVETTSAWRKQLPSDLLPFIPDDSSGDNEELIALQNDLSGAGARHIPEIIRKYEDLLSRAGRSCRIRILSWAINRSWPDVAMVINRISKDDEAGGEAGGGDGRSKVAPFFKADLEAMGLPAAAYLVRAAAARATVNAIGEGLMDFEQNFDLRTGGVR